MMMMFGRTPGANRKHRWPVLHAQPGPGFDPEQGQQKKNESLLSFGKIRSVREEGGRSAILFTRPVAVGTAVVDACMYWCVCWGHVDRIAVGEVSGWLPVACISNFPDKNTGRCLFYRYRTHSRGTGNGKITDEWEFEETTEELKFGEIGKRNLTWRVGVKSVMFRGTRQMSKRLTWDFWFNRYNITF